MEHKAKEKTVTALNEDLFESLRVAKDLDMPDDSKWIILSHLTKAIREVNSVALKQIVGLDKQEN